MFSTMLNAAIACNMGHDDHAQKTPLDAGMLLGTLMDLFISAVSNQHTKHPWVSEPFCR